MHIFSPLLSDSLPFFTTFVPKTSHKMGKKHLLALLTASVCLTLFAAGGGWKVNMATQTRTADELRCMIIDSRGLLWVGTSSGLCTFDGYTMRAWQGRGSTVAADVRCLTEDSVGHLWMGTNDGLLRLNLTDGSERAYRLPKASQRIVYALFTATDGTLYVGTDDGFSIYDDKKDTFRNFNCDNTLAIFPDGRRDTVWGYSVKTFEELTNGDIVMGTWSNGLLRYSPQTGVFHTYAAFNDMNSAYTLSLDRRERLWIGTWADGLFCLDHADDYKLSTLRHVWHSSTPVHDVCENPADGDIWMATDEGVVGVSSLVHTMRTARRLQVTTDGRVWALAQTGRIECLTRDEATFRFTPTAGRVYSLYKDEQGNLISHRPQDHAPAHCIIQRSNGDLFMALGDQGLQVMHPDGTEETWHWNNRTWLRDNVEALCESRDGTLWIGQRMGISIVTPDGKGEHLEICTDSVDLTGYFIVRNITEDHEGNVWVSSDNDGIVRIMNRTCRHYLPRMPVTACFEDSRYRLWAVSPAQGLLRYDAQSDRFHSVAQSYHLPTRNICSINEDAEGGLWLASNGTLMRLVVGSDGETVVRTFTVEDGLPDCTFMPRSTFRTTDSLYFGMTEGYVSVANRKVANKKEERIATARATLIVTDLLIDGTPIADMDSSSAARICSAIPLAVRDITLPASVHRLTLELALLTYNHTAQISYSYRLNDYDRDWQYVEPGTRRVSLANLPAGTYQLHLRATDSHGQTFELPYAIAIRVLPPWYRTWWAYLIYICVLACIAWFVWRYLQMQHEVKASRRFTAVMRCVGTTFEPQKEEQSANELEATPVQQDTESAFLKKARELVMQNLDDTDYNRDRMAADLGMSVSSLYTRLHDVSGLSIQNFIKNIRLNAAADILCRDSDFRISELAYSVGFNTPKYFSQCFKKEFGVLPGEYAKKNPTGHL